MQEDDPDARVSPEEQRRIKLLRELSRLQDEETSVRGSSESLHNRWRDAVAAQPLPDSKRAELERAANALRERLDAINDARVGRDGRRGIEDAREALRELERAVTKDASSQDAVTKSNDGDERMNAADAPTSLAVEGDATQDHTLEAALKTLE